MHIMYYIKNYASFKKWRYKQCLNYLIEYLDTQNNYTPYKTIKTNNKHKIKLKFNDKINKCLNYNITHIIYENSGGKLSYSSKTIISLQNIIFYCDPYITNANFNYKYKKKLNNGPLFIKKKYEEPSAYSLSNDTHTKITKIKKNNKKY